MDIFLTIVAMVVIVVGIIGCLVPVIPGAPLSYVGLLILQATDKVDFTWQFLVIWAVVVVALIALDYIVPIIGTKKYGGTKYGVWGSGIGLVIGLFFSPWGIIVGPFLGAVIGELIGGKATEDAVKAGWGAFVGLLFGTVIKLVCCGMMLYYAIAAVA